MHKDLNVHVAGVKRMVAAWLKSGFEQPVLLMNKDNDAAANSGSAAAREHAKKVSTRGAVKLCELMGMLLNKLTITRMTRKGSRTAMGFIFVPMNTMVTLYDFRTASAEIIVNLTVYRQFMQFVRDRKMSLAYHHLVKNIWTTINDLCTIIELIILLWHTKFVGYAPGSGAANRAQRKDYCRSGHTLWFKSVFRDHVDGWQAMGTSRGDGRMAELQSERHPMLPLKHINSKAQFKQNGTAEFIEQKLNTREGQQFLQQQAQAISSPGREKKRKVAQAKHDTKTVTEHRAAKAKSDVKREAEIAAINKCILIFDITCFEDPVMLKKIPLPQIDLQLKWHRLRELETNKKTEIPALSKMNKKQKAEILVAAIRRWITRVNAGQVHLMGQQLSQPVLSEEMALESDEDEDDAAYEDKD
ncbi:hypothetical protein GGX14DRAFT_401966 [Mycena pura]|uniref:Uncharacterized protein n=1 Tax=Mycena pura TaxID=153505 RepID=A0AAD6Y419_9AGAR|nr:hypothetical protein GGX14DRAFT_401966 [Mycena pura]